MGFFDYFRRDDTTPDMSDHAAIVSRYKRLRATGSRISNKLVERLTKDAIDEGGRKLGILQRGILVFNSEDETAVLMDYCIYDVRRGGRNAIEQHLIDSPPEPESDEMVCLQAMQHATYSMLLVESVVRGVGVMACDILSHKTFLVVDMGLSKTGVPGALIASRLLHHEGFAMTSGAAIPITVLPKAERESLADKLARTVVLDPDGYFDPAPIIRKCLQSGCTSQIQYEDPTGGLIGRVHSGEIGPHRRFNRNSPCPCGSGKKYKQCCMKRSANRR